MVGKAKTDSGAVLLGAPATGVCVVATPEVWLALVPGVLLVTAKLTVQLPLAGIVIPLKVRLVAPAAKVFGVVPAQVPPTAPPTAPKPVSASLNEAPVSALLFGFVRVRVRVELPPMRMLVGAKALLIVGSMTGTKT